MKLDITVMKLEALYALETLSIGGKNSVNKNDLWPSLLKGSLDEKEVS